MATKVCPGCENEKDLDEFYTDAVKGTRSRCIACEKAYGKDWYRKNKRKNRNRSYKWIAKNPDEVRSKRLQNAYGITAQAYDQMLADQDGVCALCHKPEKAKSRSGAIRALAVDHCHDTGRVRGLLCRKCNQILGEIGDKLESAQKLVLYMKG